MQKQIWPLSFCLLASLASPVAFGMAKPVPTVFPQGYGPLSKVGSEVLNTLVSNREWRLSREIEWMDGSARSREIYQKLQLSLYGSVASKNVCEEVRGWSFSLAASAFGPEIRGENVSSFNANQYLTSPYGHSETCESGGLNQSDFLFEQATADGGYRFRFRFYLDVRFPSLDYALATSSEKLSLYPDDRVCEGTVCRSLEEVNLTKILVPDFLVLEFNPKTPGKMIVEASDHKFLYSAPFPTEPIAIMNLCSSFSSTELRAAKPGFKCRLSKLGAEGQVATFERVERAGFGEAWKDSSGLIWSDILERRSGFQHAEDVCANVGGRLPMRFEHSRMRDAFVEGSSEAQNLMPKFDQVTWTKDMPQLKKAAGFFYYSVKRPVRCVVSN